MAFDYGSIDLGLKNPFKLLGKVTAVRGTLQALLGVYLLITAAQSVKETPIVGWVFMLGGILLLTVGIIALSSGIYATLRYFVGRNHPTSLAKNVSKSEGTSAREETKYVAYTAKQLEEMLVGRKNTTFTEPNGLLARFLHSIFPKLLYMPYPIRNSAQRLFAAWSSTAVMLVAYGLVAFVSLAGFAGEIGELAFPVYSSLLAIYLINTWRVAGQPIARSAEKSIDALAQGSLIKLIVVSLMLPVVVGLACSWAMQTNGIDSATAEQWLAALPSVLPGYYIFGVLAIGLLCSLPLIMMLKERLKLASPTTEVSELRENWQESVHPDEIFINLDNLVMANRRYKEVPNRIYRALDPKLREQVEGKGSFRGEMIQEVQPKVKDMPYSKGFSMTRAMTLLSGNLLFVVSAVLITTLAFKLSDIIQYINSDAFSLSAYKGIDTITDLTKVDSFSALSSQSIDALHLLLIGLISYAFARLLCNAARVFYSEIQFESLLVYFKCEGTFTESKISTGTGIHDSTRSENTLVRCSITPWVIVSNIVSTTFAASGMRNLEHPRYILAFNKDEEQLGAIKHDVKAFLKDRESIAAITSERDLGNASQIHQLNQQTRALADTPQATQNHLTKDDDAAGYLRKKEDLETES